MTATFDRVTRLVTRITYKGNQHSFFVLEKRGLVFIQHYQWLTNVTKPEQYEYQKGRKWYISEHATDSEILQTALRAVLDFEEHEARESFRVDGSAPYSPHIQHEMLGAAAKYYPDKREEICESGAL